ncbi:MAG: ECF transporter S component [Clostridiales bacterium]|nr:ECF transporter S component [Clostridiales bacterium]
MRRDQKLLEIVYFAVASALVTVFTLVVRIPSINGYVNFGDIMIFVVAAMLGKKFGFVAGAFGSALADIIASYFIYAPATFLIKGVEGLLFAVVYEKLKNQNYGLLVAGIIAASEMILGYFVYEYFVYGYAAAVGSVFGNVMQGSISLLVAAPIIIAVKKTGINLLKQN